MKLTFNVKLESQPEPEVALDLSIDIPDKYGKMGLESVKLVAAVKNAIDKIKEALNEDKDSD